jgi:hypothetical protein
VQDVDITNPQAILARLQAQARAGSVDFTVHAQQEMAAETITAAEVLQAIATGQVLENYPTHQRGACCLLYGRTSQHRPLHLVCTTAQRTLIIVTVYEPMAPKWTTPTQRRSR